VNKECWICIRIVQIIKTSAYKCTVIVLYIAIMRATTHVNLRMIYQVTCSLVQNLS